MRGSWDVGEDGAIMMISCMTIKSDESRPNKEE
jgi:hypothetical protein